MSTISWVTDIAQRSPTFTKSSSKRSITKSLSSSSTTSTASTRTTTTVTSDQRRHRHRVSSVITDSSHKGGTGRRTLDDVRKQVAQEVGVRAITRSQVVNGTRIGVSLALASSSNTSSQSADVALVEKIAEVIESRLMLGSFVFVVATTGRPEPSPSSASPSPVVSPGGSRAEMDCVGGNLLVVTGSSETAVQRAVVLVLGKFSGRVRVVDRGDRSEGGEESAQSRWRWSALVSDLGGSSYDEPALWDILRQAAVIVETAPSTPLSPTMAAVDPRVPPSGSRGIQQMLTEARAQLVRLTPLQAYGALRAPNLDGVDDPPVVLVDLRREVSRRKQGTIPGAVVVDRARLEWSFDPRSDTRLGIVDRYDLRVVLVSEDGDVSSLAAMSLRELGLMNVMDVVGGFEAWCSAGLPVEPQRARSLFSLEGEIV